MSGPLYKQGFPSREKFHLSLSLRLKFLYVCSYFSVAHPCKSAWFQTGWSWNRTQSQSNLQVVVDHTLCDSNGLRKYCSQTLRDKSPKDVHWMTLDGHLVCPETPQNFSDSFARSNSHDGGLAQSDPPPQDWKLNDPWQSAQNALPLPIAFL